MSFIFNVPTSSGPIQIAIEFGQSLFILGANGAGKSSLMQKLYVPNRSVSRRISAHRQTWFESGSNSLSSAQRKDSTTHIQHYDQQEHSRWKDPYATQRASVALFDLIDSQNVRAREIASAVDASNLDLAAALAKKDAPLTTINQLLRLSNIAISISVAIGDEIIATRNGGPPYSVAQLSDGERNALLIAAEVLTAPPGTLMLIDEPERHLHRSIISPLLSNLFRYRSDCVFVVSTHDVELCTDNRDAKVLLLRSCRYENNTVLEWEADYLPEQGDLDDSVRENIIGGRRKVLFVEGTEQSMDRPLYSIVFPNVTIVSTVSCRDVEHAVAGMDSSGKLHWLKAWGIVDNDHRTPADIEKLKAGKIHALDFYSVESIYYHPEVQKRVAVRQAAVDGADPAERAAKASEEAIATIRPHIERLCTRVAEKELRENMMGSLPKSHQIATGAPITITIDCAEVMRAEVARLSQALDSGDILTAIAHYPIRETPALGRIATNLGFKDRRHYESAVLKLLIDDQNALQFVRSLFADLLDEIEAA